LTIPYGNTRDYNFESLIKWSKIIFHYDLDPSQLRGLHTEFAFAVRKIERYEVNALIATMNLVNSICGIAYSPSVGTINDTEHEKNTQFLLIPIIVSHTKTQQEIFHSPPQTIMTISVYNPFYESILLPLRELSQIEKQKSRHKYIYLLTYINNNFFKWLLTNSVISQE
jgi:hypothetical protein